MERPRAILVPTDFSASAEAALGCALAVARSWGAAVHLVHVVTCLDGASNSEQSCPQRQRCVVGQAGEASVFPPVLPSSDVALVRVLLRGARPDEALAEYAKRKGIELVVTARRMDASEEACPPDRERASLDEVIGPVPCPVLVVADGSETSGFVDAT